MEKLTAEMKAEIQAKRLAAEVNAKLRTKAPEPKFQEPKRPVKVVPEKQINYYRDGITTISNWYWEYDGESIKQSSKPTYKPRR